MLARFPLLSYVIFFGEPVTGVKVSIWFAIWVLPGIVVSPPIADYHSSDNTIDL